MNCQTKVPKPSSQPLQLVPGSSNVNAASLLDPSDRYDAALADYTVLIDSKD